MSQRPAMKHVERVGSLLNKLLSEPGTGEQISRHQVWLIWDKLVGEQIAARAKPLRLRKGVLEVQIDHPVWMQQLQMMKPQILAKITEKIPSAGITDIYLRQSRNSHGYQPAKSKKSTSPPAWLKEELSAEEKEVIEAELAKIDNPELKDEMRRFFTLQKRLDNERNSR